MQWEVIASLAAGLAIAGALMAWPQPVLICVGAVSLLLGILALATLKVMSIPALIAVLAGIGLIGFGRLVGTVEQLLKEARMRQGTSLEGTRDPTTTEPKSEFVGDERIEPRL